MVLLYFILGYGEISSFNCQIDGDSSTYHKFWKQMRKAH